jgi:two-component system sensor histidine kinase HydH
MATNLLSASGRHDPRISREMAEAIVSGIAEIEAIVSALLDYARDTRLDLQEYPLGRILAPVVEGCEAEARQRGVTFTAQGLGLGLLATVDGPRLRQVFANVVTNALEATDRRPDGRVEVSLSHRESGAVVEVRDNGVGMDAEHRDKIFLPFFTTKPTGTGLGMAIVKKIMDLHGGEIEIDSAQGRGTTVRLVLPRVTVGAPTKVG